MTGNRVFYSRIDGIDSFVGKGIQNNGGEFESGFISASLSRFMSSQSHYLQVYWEMCFMAVCTDTCIVHELYRKL